MKPYSRNKKINLCKKFYAEAQLTLHKQYALKVASVLRKAKRKKATDDEINKIFDFCVMLERRGHFESGLVSKRWQKKSLKFAAKSKLWLSGVSA